MVVGSADWIPGRELYVPHLLRSCTSDMFCSPRGVRRQYARTDRMQCGLKVHLKVFIVSVHRVRGIHIHIKI